MIKHVNRATLAGVCLVPAAVAFAQGADEESELALAYGDKAYVSIATGHQQQLHRAPAVASVITAEEIETMGATTLDQVLETVPGVHVSRASVRYAAMYAIRGLGAGGQTNPQVLLMQNGIPMTTMANGDKGSAWADVPVDNIARIEVIRGPGSALYGADAFAGVINIITKTAADVPGSEFGLRAGSFNSRDAWVQHGGQVGPFQVAAYLRTGSTDGQREPIVARTGPAGPVNVGYDAIDGSLDVSYDTFRLRAGYKLRDQLGTGAGVGSALDPTHKGRAEEFTADFSWTNLQLADNWGAGATASTLYYLLQYPNNILMGAPSAAFPTGQIGGPNQWERQLRFSAYATYQGFSGHQLRVGIGHDDLDLYKARTYRNFAYVVLPSGRTSAVYTGPGITDYTDTQPHLRPHVRTVQYWYAQDEWQLARDWALTLGVRHDKYSDFGGTTNPRAALVWEAAYNLTAKLLYGRAFRAPAFTELYGINPVANGNPSLRPEKIATGEAAVSWQANDDLQLNLSLFRYDAKELIRLVGTAYANTGAQHGTGMEAEAVWDPTRNVRITANYSTQKSIDEATDRDAGYAPHDIAYVRADWLWRAGWLASLQVTNVADRVRPVGDLRPAVPDYRTVDFTLRTSGEWRHWNFAGSVRNLFNARVMEPSISTVVPSDLPLARRSLYLQASYRM